MKHNIKSDQFMTEHGIATLFDYFRNNVMKNAEKFSGHDLVAIFTRVLCGDADLNIGSSGKSIAFNGRKVSVDGKAFSDFMETTGGMFSEDDLSFFKGVADRLICDADRRMSGDFWTPTPLVDYVHDMICGCLGHDWKEKCVVWDNCWGTGNLTRDYRFGNLYCSTLLDGELEMGKRNNADSVKFQFDFLNDPIPMPGDLLSDGSKLPDGLIASLASDKPFVFLINPPYGTVNNMGFSGTSKKGISETMVNRMMSEADAGACVKNLYAQFLYRIMAIKRSYKLTKCFVCMYSPTLFMTGPSFRVFRKSFLNEFSYVKGCQFKASCFANVSYGWGISFTIWESGKTADKENFVCDLVDDVDGEMEIVGSKTLYNTDFRKSGNNWIKETVYGKKTYDAPQMTSAIRVKQTGRCVVTKDSLGYFVTNGNNVESSVMSVALFSGAYSRPCGYSITEDNFTRCMSLFSARKLVTRDWINSKDEFFAPNEGHEKYAEFASDSIAYSLFHSACNFTSLRNVEYRGKKWDIRNNFFWMPKSEILEFAVANGMSGTYADLDSCGDSFLYDKISDMRFSDESKSVLEMASEIVRLTFKHRLGFDKLHPEYQIMNWDCGWYQVKAVACEYAKVEYEEFVRLFNALESKMLPMVYELGFLKK